MSGGGWLKPGVFAVDNPDDGAREFCRIVYAPGAPVRYEARWKRREGRFRLWFRAVYWPRWEWVDILYATCPEDVTAVVDEDCVFAIRQEKP